MVRKVWYEAIDPYYSDEVQTFIGATWQELEEQEYEYDKWLGREHPAGIRFIYEKRIIYESACDEYEKGIYDNNYKRYLQKKESSNM